jgi:hypothetical protein
MSSTGNHQHGLLNPLVSFGRERPTCPRGLRYVRATRLRLTYNPERAYQAHLCIQHKALRYHCIHTSLRVKEQVPNDLPHLVHGYRQEPVMSRRCPHPSNSGRDWRGRRQTPLMTLRATICAKAGGRVGYWRFCRSPLVKPVFSGL